MSGDAVLKARYLVPRTEIISLAPTPADTEPASKRSKTDNDNGEAEGMAANTEIAEEPTSSNSTGEVAVDGTNKNKHKHQRRGNFNIFENTVRGKSHGIETQSLRPLRPNLKEFKWLRVFGEAKAMAIETQSVRPLRPNLKEFKWLRVFGPQCRVSIAMTFASHIMMTTCIISLIYITNRTKQESSYADRQVAKRREVMPKSHLRNSCRTV